MLVIALAGGAVAHTGATGVVLQRMMAMDAMGKASKALAGMVKGELPYEADQLRAHARTLGQHSGSALTKLFPEGSIFGPSEATPAVWQDWARFSELADRLAVLSQSLEAAADNGLSTAGELAPAEMQASEMTILPVDAIFAEISRTCLACHKQFREKK